MMMMLLMIMMMVMIRLNDMESSFSVQLPSGKSTANIHFPDVMGARTKRGLLGEDLWLRCKEAQGVDIVGLRFGNVAGMTTN